MGAIEKGYSANFKTLLRAADAGHLCLMDCQDKKTKRPVRVICAVNKEGGRFDMVPMARLFDGNPYDELNPPNPDGGYFSEEEEGDAENQSADH